MISDQDSDEIIVRRVIHGDVESFREIVRRYQGHLFSIGMRFFKNEDDARDFTQEVFIRAYSNLSAYKARAPFKYWLIKIAYNHGINGVNARKVDGEFTEELMEPDETTPETVHVHDEVRGVLLAAIAKLPEKYQVCIDFFFFLGLPYHQIEEITGIPVNTIKSHVLRAKGILRDELKGTIAEEYHDL